MTDRVILTEEREKVINGEYEGSDAALRNQKYRLRKSSRTALNELVEIAESPYIDQTEIFDADDVFRLLRALLTPKAKYHRAEDSEFAGIITDEDTTAEWSAYSNRLQMQMSKLLLDDRTDE